MRTPQHLQRLLVVIVEIVVVGEVEILVRIADRTLVVVIVVARPPQDDHWQGYPGEVGVHDARYSGGTRSTCPG